MSSTLSFADQSQGRVYDQELLGAFEHLMRTQPPRDILPNENTECLEWLGRAIALLSAWDSIEGVQASLTVDSFHNPFGQASSQAYRAASDVFFIDPYLDTEFVVRYLPQIRQGVAIRLLTGTKQTLLSALRPALALFNTQQSANAIARSTNGLHDRYVFIDGAAAYQSGASFKDGAVNAPTALIQITDPFAAINGTYEQMWSTATPVLTNSERA